MRYHTAFYCPIHVTLIHDMTLEKFLVSDYYDNDELPNPESPVSSELLEVVTTDIAERQNKFQPLDGCGDITPYFQLEKLSAVMHKGDVWLKMDCIAAETCDPGRLKDSISEALDDMAIAAGFYEIGKDLCVVELCPYEYYNQITCSAPPCKENKVLTESEFTALIAEHDHNNMHLYGVPITELLPNSPAERNSAAERRNTMTNLQEEICRLLPKEDCTARYDEKTGHLNIDYEGTELLSLHADGIIYYKKENQSTERRRDQYHQLIGLIHKIAEYVRLYDAAPQMEAEAVKEYRRLASYNGVVMAGMKSEQHGYMFTTWLESANRKRVDYGDYSPNYDYVKQAFVVRSGLVDERRLFRDEQLKTLYHCLRYTAENSENLTYEQEQKLKELTCRMEDLLPGICNEIPEQSFQQNI